MENNVIEQNITYTIESNYMPYTMSVIVSRAIPEIDGFKPAHRKLLYTMYKMGLLTGNRIKSADVVGQTMRLNPHGDGAIYETLVRLTRGNDALLHPFIDSKGNFGKQYSRDMAYAASRYTEVKLDGICTEIFKEIDKNTVDYIDNYNGTMKEPVLFPTTFPNVLVTPNQGIAVGMASSICSFNLKEVCAGTIAYIKNRDIDLKKYLIAPDFSTGGELIYNEKELQGIYDTGRGSIKLRAKYTYDKKNSCIEITEIPYSTTIEVIIDKIISLVKSNKVKDINDVRDETDLNGLKITIDIKRAANPDILMHKLFSLTTLSDSFSCNFNILVNGKPRVMGIKEILDEWIVFRINCLKRQYAYEIEKKSEKEHLLEGLAKILIDIDKAIKIIRNTDDDSKVIPNLMKGFEISQQQAEFIAEIKLRNLNKEYLLNRINERASLQKDIAELRDIISNERRIKDIICDQLKDISKKYGKDRRTDIIYEHEIPEIPDEHLIEDYGIRIILTEQNYFKKIPLSALRTSPEQNLKQGDRIIQEFDTTNKNDLLMFSDKCNVYKAKAHELNECKASSLGEYMTNMLGLDDNEQIIYIVSTIDYTGFLITGFENGKFAKILLETYATKVNRKKLINAYSDKSPLKFIAFISDDSDVIAVRDNAKAVMFNTSLLTAATTKNSVGVQCLRLAKNSKMTKAFLRDNLSGVEDIEHYRIDKIPLPGHFIKGDLPL